MRPQSRASVALLLGIFSLWAASCAVPLGPGYTIEKQQVRVRFVAAPEPRIRVEADFQLKNTGNTTLKELEMRLPGRRRFQYENASAHWDSATLALQTSADNSRNTVATLREPWNKSARHTLHLAVEFSPPREDETAVSFSSDAFFLPAAGWSAELLPPGGLFANGGTPPKTWELLVAVPEGFQVHASGRQKKSQRKNGELTILAEQGPQDPYPFVIAGRFHTEEIGKGKGKIHLWARQQQEPAGLRETSEALGRVVAAYDAAFGERGKESGETWIVECPVTANCFTNVNPGTARLLAEDENERTTAEMISQDTMVVDLSGGAPRLAAAAAPSLAASWLGYGQNPAFYEQGPPLSLLPAFAASIGQEAAAGTESRGETIRNALRLVPTKAKPREAEEPAVLRAKSFLFFYALQDRYGREVFRKAIAHMLYARRGRGFELDDLIAAFEQETHQNVAEFVRHWMKRPGVPEDFRARYEGTAAAAAEPKQESTP
ncbi:MAG TPA: hypothetical protein VE263_00250 [Candidatus Angelobacter sp.]|nr:hypothetical protein [Candidatus Angelobacter sp.]